MDQSQEPSDKHQADSNFYASEMSNSLLNKIESLGNMGHWEIDILTGTNKWSAQLFQILGLDPAVTRPSTEVLLAAIHPSDQAQVRTALVQSLESGCTFKIAARCIRGSGELRFFISEGVIDLDPAGVPLRFFGIVKDRTDDIQPRQNLIQNSLQLKNILDTTQDLIFLTDEEGEFLSVSKSCKKILGYEPESLIGKSYRALIHPEDIHQSTLGGKPTSDFENRYFRKDGSIVYLSWSATLDESTHSIFAIARDITQRKEEEKKMKALVDRNIQAQTIGKLGNWELDILTKKFIWSDEMYKIWEVPKGDLPIDFDFLFSTIHPDDLPDFVAQHTKLWTEHKPLDLIYQLLLPSGQIKFIHIIGEPEDDPDLGVKRYHGTVQDVTREKQVEGELRDRNRFIESTLENLPVGIAVSKISTGEATYVNLAFFQIYGWTPEILKDAEEFYRNIFPDPDYRKTLTDQIRLDLNSGEEARMSYKAIPIVTQTGEKRFINAKNILLHEQDLMISTVTDETDRYWAEQHIRISNERFHLATQTVSDAIWDWDITEHTFLWGEGYNRLFGYPEGGDLHAGDHWPGKIHPDDLAKLQSSIDQAKADKNQLKWKGEYRFLKFDQSYAFVRENIVIVRDPAGQPIRMVGALQDITLEKEKENHLKLLESVVINIRDGILVTEAKANPLDHKIIYANARFLKSSGYTAEEIMGKSPAMFIGSKSDALTVEQMMADLINWKPSSFEIIQYRKDGSTHWSHLSFTPVSDQNGDFSHWIVVERDISQEKKNEQSLRYKTQLKGTIAEINQSLLEDSDWEKPMLAHFATIGQTIGTDRVYFYKNYTDPVSQKLYARLVSEWTSGKVTSNLNNPSQQEISLERFPVFMKKAIAGQPFILRESQTNGPRKEYLKSRQTKSMLQLPIFVAGEFFGFIGFDDCFQERDWSEDEIGFLTSVTNNLAFAIERKNTETQLEESNKRFSIISDATNDAVWDWNLETGERFWGEGFNKLFGIKIEKDEKVPDFWKERIHPADYPTIQQKLTEFFKQKTQNFFEFEYQFKIKDGTYAHVIDRGSVIRNRNGKPVRLIGAMIDITHRKMYEDSLKALNSEMENTNRELANSNKELEQFAYVASHDLQEPLRMITSFLGLIEKKYEHQIDEKGLQYIQFAIDGAKRMKVIILDLLEFSRVGNTSEAKKLIDSKDLLQEVRSLNARLLDETGAVLHLGHLPIILCHGNSIIQLLQNLITNGIKYQAKGNQPEIWIEGKELEKEWLFTVRDNGIGIDPEFKEKIFIIFQRLHQKEQFSGTGIGLAICKKIVEFHGGKIWVESRPGFGSTFSFTISK